MKKNKAFSLVELSVVILVIGILIAGVTQSGRLIRQMKLSTARSVTSSSDVASIRDITAWFETSNEGIFTNVNDVVDVENNNEIKSWKDINPQKSLPDRPLLTNSATGKMPKYVVNGINGIPAMYFDGDDYIETTNIPTLPLISGDKTFSMFAVFRPDKESLETKRIVTQIGNGTTLSNDYASIGFIGSTGSKGKAGFILNSATANNWQKNTVLVEQNDYMVGALADFTPTTQTIDSVKLFVNNQEALASADIATMNTYPSLSVASAKFVIGGSAAATVGDNFKGMIAEVIVFDRKLKDEEVKSVMGYLRKKYNINK
jgi:prepilin-type N-terminal cleavage/methylation domain-containing protein